MYRYLHDQTLRYMSHGLTPAEIGEKLMLPNVLSRQWFARGYYGAVAHNVAAIYAHYMGPYDGNPANLHPLAPQVAGAKYVDYMGGAEQAIMRARRDFELGEFRWVVEVMKHVIFDDPTNGEARDLSADAMEQLGYQSESATWRNAYLLAARELRSRRAGSAPATIPIGSDMLTLLPLGHFLEYLAIRVKGEQAQHLKACFDWILQDKNGRAEQQRLTLSNGALNHMPGQHASQADAVIVTSRTQLAAMLADPDGLLHALDAGQLDLRGDATLFRQFLVALDCFDPMFNVVEP
jgi:alkyl sulfatase BDS1-like metallo-beta-lactamase superfamily hydrolase